MRKKRFKGNWVRSIKVAEILSVGMALTLSCVAQQSATPRHLDRSVSVANAAISSESNPDSLKSSSLHQHFTIGSGDVLNISVWKEKDLDFTATVRPDGKISVPLIGEVAVINLTPMELRDLLKERLASFVIEPAVTVQVVEIHSRMVYITGEVARPGAYPLNSPLNVLQLIAQAGGLTEFASRKGIHLVRADTRQKDLSLDYKNLTKLQDASRNAQLLPGDTVVVR